MSVRHSLLMAMIGLSLGTPAFAQGAAVDDSGRITITGQVSSITRDSFTITHDAGSSEVMFDNMNSKNIEKLREANILQNGSYVTVEGKLTDGPFNHTVIEASDIYVQAVPKPAE